MSTSFVQFQRCGLCRINHRKLHKHVYSKCHQDRIRSILKKYGAKVKLAKKALTNPEVREAVFEMDQQFWCYFCEKEVALHYHLPDATLLFSGIATHLASTNHKDKTEVFWVLHRLDKSKKAPFIFEAEEVNKFEALAETCIQNYLAEERQKRCKLAKQLESQQKVQQRLVQHTRQVNMSGTSSFSVYQTHIQQHAPQLMMPGMRTIGASGEGLSCVTLRRYDPEIGNVYTDSTPPWLRDDVSEPTTEQKMIGPTKEDFEKHLERQKKARLPANRVGAKFEHKAVTDAAWLPSFGRVWNKNRRLHSKQQFLGEWSKKRSLPKNMSLPYSTGSNISQGYFKRERTETISSPSGIDTSQHVWQEKNMKPELSKNHVQSDANTNSTSYLNTVYYDKSSILTNNTSIQYQGLPATKVEHTPPGYWGSTDQSYQTNFDQVQADSRSAPVFQSMPTESSWQNMYGNRRSSSGPNCIQPASYTNMSSNSEGYRSKSSRANQFQKLNICKDLL